MAPGLNSDLADSPPHQGSLGNSSPMSAAVIMAGHAIPQDDQRLDPGSAQPEEPGPVEIPQQDASPSDREVPPSEPLSVTAMLKARRGQRPPKLYYESITQRIRRESAALASTPNVGSQAETRPSPAVGGIDMQRRLINCMLDSRSGLTQRSPRGNLMRPETAKARSAGKSRSAGQFAQPLRSHRPTGSTVPTEERLEPAFKAFTPRPEMEDMTRDRGLQGQLNVAIRNELWLRQKNDRVAQRLVEKKAMVFEGCTFRPRFESQEHQYAHTSNFNVCGSVYKGLSPSKLSTEELNIIMHSNSYTQIGEVKSRSRSRDRSQVVMLSQGGIRAQIPQEKIEYAEDHSGRSRLVSQRQYFSYK